MARMISSRQSLVAAVACTALMLAACSSAPVKPTKPAPEASAEPDLMEQLKKRMAAPVVRKEKIEEPVAQQQESQSSHQPAVTVTTATQPLVAPEIASAYQQALEAVKADKNEEALQLLEDLSLKAPTYAGPLINQGLVYLKLKKYQQAEVVLQRAIQVNDKNPYAWNQLGIALREQGKFAEAKSAYEQAITLDNRYAKAHFNLGVLADLYLQDLPLALTHYEQYQALQTKADPAVNNWIVDLQKRTGVWKPPAPKPAPAPEPEAATEPAADASTSAPATATP